MTLPGGRAEALPDAGSRANAAMDHAAPRASAPATSIPGQELRLRKPGLRSLGDPFQLKDARRRPRGKARRTGSRTRRPVRWGSPPNVRRRRRSRLTTARWGRARHSAGGQGWSTGPWLLSAALPPGARFEYPGLRSATDPLGVRRNKIGSMSRGHAFVASDTICI